VKLPKAKKVRQATALQCFLFVALRGDFDEELRRCRRNSLCECCGWASGEKCAADLRNDFDGI
jgi:hypothetical protein